MNTNIPNRKTFLEFARDIYANSDEIVVSNETSVPEKYKTAVDKIANKFRDNGDLFAERPYGHMQDVFTEDVDARINEITEDGDVPDGILNTLAMNIYGGFYNNLVDDDSKAIINALAIYIILSSNSKEENTMNTNETNIPDPVDVIKSDVTSSADTIIEAEINTAKKMEDENKKFDCIGYTNGDVEPLPIRLFNFNEHDITRHLQNKVLKCPLIASYHRYDGAPGMPYVIMKIAIPAKYAVERLDVGTGPIANMVKNEGGNIRFKKSLIDDLSMFMFPKYVADGSILKIPEEREKMIRRGVVNDHLYNLIRFSTLRFSKDDNGNDYACIFLRPERIITHMLYNKATQKPYGEITIEDIVGGDRYEDGHSDPITWHVVLNCLHDPEDFGSLNVNIEDLFRNTLND